MTVEKTSSAIHNIEDSFQIVLLEAMSLTALIDDEIVESEIALMQEAMSSVAGIELSKEEISSFVHVHADNRDELLDSLKENSESLSEAQKEIVIKCVLNICAADEKFEKSEMIILIMISDVISMKEETLKAILRQND